jgi:hypothetical protein
MKAYFAILFFCSAEITNGPGNGQFLSRRIFLVHARKILICSVFDFVRLGKKEPLKHMKQKKNPRRGSNPQSQA